MPAGRLRLLVLRTHDLAASRAIYEALGFTFRDEKHGDGPSHLSAELGTGAVLELYPATGDPIERVRLGFAVDDVEAVVAAMQRAGAEIMRPTGPTAVVQDLDGRLIELSRV